MNEFDVHTRKTAPTESAELRASAEKANEFIPTLLGVMAESPATLGADYTKEQVLEVIFGIRFKTLSNYVNQVTGTPLDNAFATQAWTPLSDRRAG